VKFLKLAQRNSHISIMGSLKSEELDGIYAFAIQLAKDAGARLQRAANARTNGNGNQKPASALKASEVDIVTETDEGLYSSTCGVSG
jgi:myo-inositol-1(or 4)-monophosphatase